MFRLSIPGSISPVCIYVVKDLESKEPLQPEIT